VETAGRDIREGLSRGGRIHYAGALSLAVLCGCTTPVGLSPSTLKPTSVAVVAVVEPAAISVKNVQWGLGQLELIFFPRHFVQAAVDERHTDKYTEMIRANNVVFATSVSTMLSDRLQANGYKVINAADQHVPRSSDADEFDYSSIRTDADAILHAWFDAVGYYSSADSFHYRPWVVLRVRLIDVKSRKEVYFKTFWTGRRPSFAEFRADLIAVACGDTPYFPGSSYRRDVYSFGSFDELTSRFQDSVIALEDCMGQIVRRVASDLTAVQ
jgi:hypothetical protein